MADTRFPFSVRIVGIMYKEKSKLYITSVLWSDQTEVAVYRALRDFKKFHRQLKKKFPAENPFTKRGKVIPRFGTGRLLKANLQKRTPVKVVHRVKALQKYCNNLMQCDTKVTQDNDLIRFFLPKEHELQPEFLQNSVMIFQSEEIPNNGQTGADTKFTVGNVTQPFVTRTYRCVAPYETKDTKNRPFKVAVDEMLDVLIKDQAGWWLVENEEKRLAWFPAPYLELCEDDEDDELDMAGVERSLYCAVRSYTAKTKDELSVNIGAVLEVLQKSDNGWWLSRYNGKAGYIPSMYLQPYTSPTFSLQKKLHSSTLNLYTTPTLLQGLSYSTQPQECSLRLKRLPKSHSVEVLSECPAQPSAVVQPSTAVLGNDSDSRKSSISEKSDETNYSFSSSSSLGLSLSSSEGEEGERQMEKDSEADSSDSGLSEEQPSPTCSVASGSSKVGPRVPPRPQTREILTRCTTYTRKAALATQARLFPQQIGNEAQTVGRD